MGAHYIVIHEVNLTRLEERVNAAMRDGYYVCGMFQVASHGDGLFYYYQPMMRDN